MVCNAKLIEALADSIRPRDIYDPEPDSGPMTQSEFKELIEKANERRPKKAKSLKDSDLKQFAENWLKHWGAYRSEPVGLISTRPTIDPDELGTQEDGYDDSLTYHLSMIYQVEAWNLELATIERDIINHLYRYHTPNYKATWVEFYGFTDNAFDKRHERLKLSLGKSLKRGAKKD